MSYWSFFLFFGVAPLPYNRTNSSFPYSGLGTQIRLSKTYICRLVQLYFIIYVTKVEYIYIYFIDNIKLNLAGFCIGIALNAPVFLNMSIGCALRLFRIVCGVLFQIKRGNQYQVSVCFSLSIQKCLMLSSCFGRSVATSPPCFPSLSVTGDLTTDRLRDGNKIQSHSREWEKLSGCLRRLVALTFIWSKGIGCSQSGQVL